MFLSWIHWREEFSSWDGQPAESRITPRIRLGSEHRISYMHVFFPLSSYGFCTFRSNASLKGQGLVGKRSGKADHLICETQATCLRSRILQRKQSLSFTHLPLQLPRHNYKIYPREMKQIILGAKIILASVDLDESIFDLGIWEIITTYQPDLASITSVCARVTLNSK